MKVHSNIVDASVVGIISITATSSIGKMIGQKMNPARHPHPHLAEHNGFTPVQASHRMNPSGGMKKDSTNHPQLPVSMGYPGASYGRPFLGSKGVWHAPHSGQNLESPISTPQCLQYISASPTTNADNYLSSPVTWMSRLAMLRSPVRSVPHVDGSADVKRCIVHDPNGENYLVKTVKTTL